MLASSAGDSNYVRELVQRMLVSEAVYFIAGGNNAVDPPHEYFGTKGIDFSLAHRSSELNRSQRRLMLSCVGLASKDAV